MFAGPVAHELGRDRGSGTQGVTGQRGAVARVTAAAFAGVVGYDLAQRRRAILRNFPIVGHLRYALEAFGPELRQYIVTSNNEEQPFSRDQRRWIDASSDSKPNVFGFGTDDEMEAVESLVIIKHSPFPPSAPADGEPGGAPDYSAPSAKILGAAHRRRHAFRPASIVNLSGMSYGSLSPVAVEALNRGAKLAGCLQNTGEGGLASAHRHGAGLLFQFGTGYFGCRDEQGRFSLERLREREAEAPVRAIEVKLSQGAKPELVEASPAIDVRERSSVVALWSDRERCAGVLTDDGDVAARATMLATGGGRHYGRAPPTPGGRSRPGRCSRTSLGPIWPTSSSANSTRPRWRSGAQTTTAPC
jgi:hypothetical protein